MICKLRYSIADLIHADLTGANLETPDLSNVNLAEETMPNTSVGE